MSTAELSSTVAPDAAAAMARVAQIQQMIAQTSESFSTTQGGAAASASSAAGVIGGALTPSSTVPSGPDFASVLSSASSAAAAPTAPSGYATYASQISAAAAQYGIDPALLYGVISQESAFNPNAVSSAGAEGLAQIMPENFASLGVTNPFDPTQSIDAGAKLLSENLQTFNGNTVDAIAAYNAGAGAVQQYGGVPPYAQTQNYVQRVLAYAASYPGAGATATAASGLPVNTAQSPTVVPTPATGDEPLAPSPSTSGAYL
jgi:soluble lytic murein transglycosylase-like protein